MNEMEELVMLNERGKRAFEVIRKYLYIENGFHFIEGTPDEIIEMDKEAKK